MTVTFTSDDGHDLLTITSDLLSEHGSNQRYELFEAIRRHVQERFENRESELAQILVYVGKMV